MSTWRFEGTRVLGTLHYGCVQNRCVDKCNAMAHPCDKAVLWHIGDGTLPRLIAGRCSWRWLSSYFRPPIAMPHRMSRRLEILYLTRLDWKLYVSRNLYTKYYFALRSIGAKCKTREVYNNMIEVRRLLASYGATALCGSCQIKGTIFHFVDIEQFSESKDMAYKLISRSGGIAGSRLRPLLQWSWTW